MTDMSQAASFNSRLTPPLQEPQVSELPDLAASTPGRVVIFSVFV